MILNNKYGYKVCYKENNNKLKLSLITNSFDLAVLEIKNKNSPTHSIWHLFEIKNKNEYNKLWKGCPFMDNL